MLTLDRVSIAVMLAQAGFRQPITFLGDATYAPPRSDWLTGEFAAWFRSALFALNVGTYKPEAWDCDDYTDLYAALARLCHRRTSADTGTALPVGVMHYRSPQGPHAAVVAITSDRGLVAVEPQTGALLTLTPAEAATAWLVKL